MKRGEDEWVVIVMREVTGGPGEPEEAERTTGTIIDAGVGAPMKGEIEEEIEGVRGVKEGVGIKDLLRIFYCTGRIWTMSENTRVSKADWPPYSRIPY